MSTVPLSRLKKGAVVHIDSIAPNPFSSGMPLQVIAVGGFGRGPFAVRLGNQSQFSLRLEEAGKIMCRIIEAV